MSTVNIEPADVEEWKAFLATVEIRGPMPITFAVTRSGNTWMLESSMLVQDHRRPRGECEACSRPPASHLVVTESPLPHAPDRAAKAAVVRRKVLFHYEHEALEGIFVDGEQMSDPNRVEVFRCGARPSRELS